MGADIAKALCYKSYRARPVYSNEGHVLYGKISGICDLVDFQTENAEDVKSEFRKAVDGYLAFCAGIGKEPDLPPAGKAKQRGKTI